VDICSSIGKYRKLLPSKFRSQGKQNLIIKISPMYSVCKSLPNFLQSVVGKTWLHILKYAAAFTILHRRSST
jgi:hypothetical protein